MNIKMWRTAAGSSPVSDFIGDQEDKPASRIMKDIEHLEEQGLRLLATKKMKRFTGYNQLYELVTNFKGVGYRIIFTVINGDAWLLEAFKKKGDVTPQRYINTSLARRNQILAII